MSLASEYQRQLKWRDWGRALELCPIQPGQNVLDLGCGPGDLSRELSTRGAIVTGVDSNKQLLRVAQENCPDTCQFIEQDLAHLALKSSFYDGLWCSFAAAYFTNFDFIFNKWLTHLKTKAWVCLVDVDDMLMHEPLKLETKQTIGAFYDEALLNGRYDYKVGRKLALILEQAGFNVISYDLRDMELSFSGPADPQVIQAWADRFDRMHGLKAFLNEMFVGFKDEFLQALASKNHKTSCRVICCVGIRP